MDPRTYAIHKVRYPFDGDAITLAPGDVRGTLFVHELVRDTCPYCFTGAYPSVACAECRTRVAYRIWGADWDNGSARPALVATHWRTRGVKSEIYRDDPPV